MLKNENVHCDPQDNYKANIKYTEKGTRKISEWYPGGEGEIKTESSNGGIKRQMVLRH